MNIQNRKNGVFLLLFLGSKGSKGEPARFGAKNCKELLDRGVVLSGWYTIYPKNCVALTVLCDMHTDGGGWIVFQRRIDGSVDFFLDWEFYKRGFGSQLTEFWLGNDNIHLLTSLGENELRVDLTDFNNTHTYAKFDLFRISNEMDDYRLTVGNFVGGTAGNSLTYHKNMPFSTKDKDPMSKKCAQQYKGAWWYNSCHLSNLNGKYLVGQEGLPGDGAVWKTNHGFNYSFKRSEMKFRPTA
uniref:Fibrinogen C-terminal domain-containing protein n=1 Tax=Salvator merianae TaxID=96440 RepID=A0A8D0BJJ1_SALMN